MWQICVLIAIIILIFLPKIIKEHFEINPETPAEYNWNTNMYVDVYQKNPRTILDSSTDKYITISTKWTDWPNVPKCQKPSVINQISSMLNYYL